MAKDLMPLPRSPLKNCPNLNEEKKGIEKRERRERVHTLQSEILIQTKVIRV